MRKISGIDRTELESALRFSATARTEVAEALLQIRKCDFLGDFSAQIFSDERIEDPNDRHGSNALSAAIISVTNAFMYNKSRGSTERHHGKAGDYSQMIYCSGCHQLVAVAEPWRDEYICPDCNPKQKEIK